MKQESGGGELPTASRFERPVARWRMWLGLSAGVGNMRGAYATKAPVVKVEKVLAGTSNGEE